MPKIDFLVDERRTIRSRPNSMDLCTLVSIYPKEIDEVKHTLQPGRWIIAGGTYEKPSILVVTPSSWFRDLGPKEPLIEVPVGSNTIAESIIRDYVNGIIECGPNANPGLFYVEGSKTVEQIKTDYKSLLDHAKACQANWYEALIKLGDIQWARTNGNPLSISDEMRLAISELGQTREWAVAREFQTLVRCVACQTLINNRVIVCPNCKVVLDHEKAKELGLKFAS